MNYNGIIQNLQLPVCHNFKFIREHLCYVNNYLFFDIKLNLVKKILQLNIREKTFNCNTKMLNTINESYYINFNNYILILPIKYGSRNICMITRNSNTYNMEQYNSTNNYSIDKNLQLALYSNNKYLCLLNQPNYKLFKQCLKRINNKYIQQFNQLVNLANSKLLLLQI